MPRKSKKAHILDKMYSMRQDLLNQRHTGNHIDQENNERLIQDLDEAILEASNCRYGSVESVPKSTGFVMDVLPACNESRFRSFLRINPSEFEEVMKAVETNDVYRSTASNALPVELQVAISLHWFGNETKSFNEIAALFAVGDGSTITRCIDRFVKNTQNYEAIRLLKNQHLYWPDHEERAQLLRKSYRRGELPGAIAFMDGTHVNLAERPSRNAESYYDKSKNHSIQVQIICDTNKKIRAVHTGFPGSVHDSRVLRETDVYQRIDEFLGPDEYICADRGYPLLPKIMVPFKSNSRDGEIFGLSENDLTRFNKFFSSRRVKVEHVNGLVKEMFPCLKRLNVPIRNDYQHTRACHIIECCCILYNLIHDLRTAETLDETARELLSTQENRQRVPVPEQEYDDDILDDEEDLPHANLQARTKRAQLVRRVLENL